MKPHPNNEIDMTEQNIDWTKAYAQFFNNIDQTNCPVRSCHLGPAGLSL